MHVRAGQAERFGRPVQAHERAAVPARGPDPRRHRSRVAVRRESSAAERGARNHSLERVREPRRENHPAGRANHRASSGEANPRRARRRIGLFLLEIERVRRKRGSFFVEHHLFDVGVAQDGAPALLHDARHRLGDVARAADGVEPARGVVPTHPRAHDPRGLVPGEVPVDHLPARERGDERGVADERGGHLGRRRSRGPLGATEQPEPDPVADDVPDGAERPADVDGDELRENERVQTDERRPEERSSAERIAARGRLEVPLDVRALRRERLREALRERVPSKRHRQALLGIRGLFRGGPFSEIYDVVREAVLRGPDRGEPHGPALRADPSEHPPERRGHPHVVDPRVEYVTSVAHLAERVRAAPRAVVPLEDDDPAPRLGGESGEREAPDAGADDDEIGRIGLELGDPRGVQARPPPSRRVRVEPPRRRERGRERRSAARSSSVRSARRPVARARGASNALPVDSCGIFFDFRPDVALGEHERALRDVREAPHARVRVRARADEPRQRQHPRVAPPARPRLHERGEGRGDARQKREPQRERDLPARPHHLAGRARDAGLGAVPGGEQVAVRDVRAAVHEVPSFRHGGTHARAVERREHARPRSLEGRRRRGRRSRGDDPGGGRRPRGWRLRRDGFVEEPLGRSGETATLGGRGTHQDQGFARERREQKNRRVRGDGEGGGFAPGDPATPDERREGLRADDRESEPGDASIREVARLEARAVAVDPPQRGVDELHRAEDAQDEGVAARPRVAAAKQRRDGRGDERARRDAHLEGPARARARGGAAEAAGSARGAGGRQRAEGPGVGSTEARGRDARAHGTRPGERGAAREGRASDGGRAERGGARARERGDARERRRGHRRRGKARACAHSSWLGWSVL